MSKDETDWKKVGKKTTDAGNGFIKGNKAFHSVKGKNLKCVINSSTASKVNVIDKTARSAKAATNNLPAKGDWLFRFDKSHAGTNYNHVNINPTVTGVPDPHVKLPPGTLTVSNIKNIVILFFIVVFSILFTL